MHSVASIPKFHERARDLITTAAQYNQLFLYRVRQIFFNLTPNVPIAAAESTGSNTAVNGKAIVTIVFQYIWRNCLYFLFENESAGSVILMYGNNFSFNISTVLVLQNLCMMYIN